MGLVGMLPRSWRVSPVVLRGGGRDPKGNPLPVVEVPVTVPCAYAPRATADPVDRSDVVDGTSVLYADPGFQFFPKDRIRIPVGSRGAGEWMVDGRPKDWPLGTEVGLVMG